MTDKKEGKMRVKWVGSGVRGGLAGKKELTGEEVQEEGGEGIELNNVKE